MAKKTMAEIIMIKMIIEIVSIEARRTRMIYVDYMYHFGSVTIGQMIQERRV